MARKKIEVKIKNYGIYSQWDKESKNLPKIVEFTKKVPAKLNIEFGYTLNIKKAKGTKLSFRIEHPPFKDSNGNIAPAFVGEEYINSNDYNFFLGDTIWEPIEDKIGPWRLQTFIDNATVADITIHIVNEQSDK